MTASIKLRLYSIGTWDTELQAYTPQAGAGPWCNLSLAKLRRSIQEHRRLGYTVHRRGNVRDGHEDNDTYVLIARTDGMSESEILKDWER